MPRKADLFSFECYVISLRQFDFFLPAFLEPINLNIRDRSDFWVATRLYLATSRTDSIDLQVDLIDYLRPLTISVMNYGARNKEDLAALVAIALYEPLLLTKAKDEIQLDGMDIREAAFTACLSLDYQKIPSILQMPSLDSSLELIQMCAIWFTIAFMKDLQSIMGGGYPFRIPFQVSQEDLTIVQYYCQQLLKKPGSSELFEKASLLLILVFRYQALQDFNGIASVYLKLLQDTPSPRFIEARACLDDFMIKWQETVSSTLERIFALQSSLCESLLLW